MQRNHNHIFDLRCTVGRPRDIFKCNRAEPRFDHVVVVILPMRMFDLKIVGFLNKSFDCCANNRSCHSVTARHTVNAIGTREQTKVHIENAKKPAEQPMKLVVRTTCNNTAAISWFLWTFVLSTMRANAIDAIFICLLCPTDHQQQTCKAPIVCTCDLSAIGNGISCGFGQTNRY